MSDKAITTDLACPICGRSLMRWSEPPQPGLRGMWFCVGEVTEVVTGRWPCHACLEVLARCADTGLTHTCG